MFVLDVMEVDVVLCIEVSEYDGNIWIDIVFDVFVCFGFGFGVEIDEEFD